MARKKGDGSFRKLPNGSVEFTVEIGNDIYGKRQRKRFYGNNETECRKKYKQWLKGGEHSPTVAKENTLSEWLDVWLTTYKQGNVSEGTYIDYVNLANHIKRHQIGSLKLSAVKPIHITDFFSEKSEYSYSFHKRMRFLLTSSFECAVDNDFCVKNPVKRAEMVKKVQKQKEPFTEEETRIILDFAKTDELFGLIMFIMLNTGVRSQEVCALTVEQFDFDKGILTIDRAIKRNGELGLPKNNKTRFIPLKQEVLEFIERHINKEYKYIISDSIYTSTDGLRTRYNYFFGRLNKHLESIGKNPVKLRPPHTTRHTFGTLCQKNGMPLAIVSELLGHSSTAVTDLYTHLNDTTVLSEAVKKYGLTP